MSTFGINVMDFGAVGDGVADDTQAIQNAINYASERGGGRILFPYTPGGYRPFKRTDVVIGAPIHVSDHLQPGLTQDAQLQQLTDMLEKTVYGLKNI